MARVDPFTAKRLVRFVEDFRERGGKLPTLQDFEAAGFERGLIDAAVREKILDLFYLTMTNGSIVKGYKIHVD